MRILDEDFVKQSIKTRDYICESTWMLEWKILFTWILLAIDIIVSVWV